MDVSVIIVNYNTKQITDQCIESVKKQTKGVRYEIILVDNNSTDGSREFFQKCSDIRYLYLEENVGFGRANNAGYEVATGKYIFLLNSDTILLNDAITEFYRYAEDNKVDGCLGAQLFTKELSLSPSFGYYLYIGKELVDAIKSYMRLLWPSAPVVTKMTDCAYEVEVIIGADLFFRKKTADIYGMFDPAFFMYHEENDLQRRYSTYGLKHYIIPGPRIIHLESQSTKISFNKKVMTTNSLFRYLKKWNSSYKYIFFRTIYFILKIPYVLSPSLTYTQRKKFFKTIVSSV